MIILNPMGSSNGAYLVYNGVYDYNVTHAFASSIATYLRLRGEECVLTRYTSESLTGLAYSSFIVNNAPDIIINIKCLSDLTPAPSGYTVDCNVYSALTATISAEFTKVGITPVYPLGYNVQAAKTSAKYTEITIGVGYLTNADDFTKVSDVAFMDLLAKHIVDACYGPPTKIMQPSDSVYVSDPYMYDTAAWVEDTASKLAADTGSIIEDTISNIPVRVLNLSTADSARNTPYTFHTAININGAESSESTYTTIISYRIRNTGGSGYVKVGSTIKQLQYEDDAWHRLELDYLHVDGDVLTLGANANTFISYTAVWITNSSVIGDIDNPVKSYSTFPPGYRPVTTIDPTAIKDNVGSVITSASSLIGRALDTTIPNPNAKIKESLGMLDQLQISPKAYVDGIKGTMSQVTGILGKASPGVPKPVIPKTPPVPKPSDFLAIPKIQEPTIPGLPAVPTIPGVPGVPKLPSLPKLPKLPSVPVVAKLPPFPTLPKVVVPGMPTTTGLVTPKQVGLLDASKIKPKHSALENIVIAMNRVDKRADMLNIINTMKGTTQAATNLNTTFVEKLAAAVKKAKQVKTRTEIKGEAMSKK